MWYVCCMWYIKKEIIMFGFLGFLFIIFLLIVFIGFIILGNILCVLFGIGKYFFY